VVQWHNCCDSITRPLTPPLPCRRGIPRAWRGSSRPAARKTQPPVQGVLFRATDNAIYRHRPHTSCEALGTEKAGPRPASETDARPPSPRQLCRRRVLIRRRQCPPATGHKPPLQPLHRDRHACRKPQNSSETRGESGFSVALGMIGGGTCGAAILSFGALIGRSGNTGEEYFGYWNIDVAWLGVMYGASLEQSSRR